MAADKQVNAVAARGNKNRGMLFFEDLFVTGFNDGSADGGFFDSGKTESHKSFAHAGNTDTAEVSDERWGKADVDRAAGGNQLTGMVEVTADFLGILRADNKAMSAENAFVADNVGLVVGDTDGFDRAVADTLVAVFAVGFFQPEIFVHGTASLQSQCRVTARGASAHARRKFARNCRCLRRKQFRRQNGWLRRRCIYRGKKRRRG